MAKNANDKAAKNDAAEAPKRERKVLTDAERIAKLEADLRAAREKAEAKANKAKTAAAEKRAKIRDKMVELNTKHNDLTDEIGDKAYANVTIDAAQGEAPAEATFTEHELEAV